jgi:DNA polymerase-3 subunit gamma/tau
MFENLLAQDEAALALSADIEAGRLPPALLFSGPPASGKTTAALELARALSCSQLALWGCSCPSCSRHRLLVHPDLALLGPRSFPEEIPAALELLARAPGPASAFFFARAVRKLLRRFDAFLYEGEEARLAKAAPLLRELEEELDLVAPERATAGPERATAGLLAPGAAEAAAKAALACAKLEAFVPEAPPVFSIRNLEYWARLAPLGERKTAIIENADRMLEGSRNAMLKILEEPPESVRFVLLTSRKSAIMATILSRARCCNFVARDAAGTASVLDRIFHSAEPAPSVEAFLAARRPFPPSAARERAQDFLGAALAARARSERLCAPLEALARRAEVEQGDSRSRSRALAALMESTKDFGAKDERFASSFSSFLAALSGLLSSLLREEGMDARGLGIIEDAAALVREASLDRSSLNRGPTLLAESLMYELSRPSRERPGGRSAGVLA